MAPLTYARLLSRLEALFDSIPGQLPGSENAQRVNDIQHAISAGIIAAQAGLDGDKGVPKPSQLKHEVMAKVDEINKPFEREAEDDQLTRDLPAVSEGQQSSPRSGSGKENPTVTAPATITREHPATRPATVKKTSAVTKRIISNPATTTNAGVKKSASKRVTRSKSRLASSKTLASVAATVDEQEAAAALLDLFASRSRTIDHVSPMPQNAVPYVAPTAKMLPMNAYTANNNKGKQRATFPAPLSPLPFPNLRLDQTLHANPYRRNRYGAEFLDLPPNVIDHSATPEQNFLAGVQFAMQNFTASHVMSRCGHTDDEFAERCYEYVRIELGIKSKYDLEVDAYHAERAAKETAEKAARERSVGKNFWDVI